MVVVDTIEQTLEIKGAVLYVAKAGGGWIVYLPGDALPPAAPLSHEEMSRQIAAPYADAVQAMLDAAAQALAYDGILSMVSYAGDTHRVLVAVLHDTGSRRIWRENHADGR